MNDEPLSTTLRFLQLERRIERIEVKLDLKPIDAPKPLTPPQTAQPTEIARIPQPANSQRINLLDLAPPTPVRNEPISPIPYRSQKPIPKPSREPRELEQTIGLKWAGWIGAVVLVIGAALGVKYAYDQHWFGHLSPTIKLSLIVAAGFALIGAGEYVYRRIHKIPAASLFGAGVATLFIAAYVGQVYGLYGSTATQIAMALATLVGAAVAMRGKLVSIGVLALIGGNIAPLVVGETNAPLVPFLGYLLMLQLVALVLSAWGKTGRWWTLRGLSLGSTVLWMTQLLASNRGQSPMLLSAMLIYAAIYQLELIITTLRRSPANLANAPGITFSFLVTAALTFGVLWFHLDASRMLRGNWIAGIALVCGAMGLILPRLKSSMSALGIAHRIAAVALIALWVPVTLGGANVLVGWMALSIAFALSWMLSGSVVSRFAAPVSWMLALCRLIFTTIEDLHHYPTWFAIHGTPIISQAGYAWILALVGFAVARLILTRSSESQWIRGARMVSVFAIAVWTGAAILYLPPLGATFMILIGTWLLMLPGELLASQVRPTLHAAALIVVAAVKWAVIDAFAARMSSDWSAAVYQPILNPLMAIGALIAASLAAMYFLRSKQLLSAMKDESLDRSQSLFWLISAIIGIFTIGLSFEADRIVELSRAHLNYDAWQLKNMCWTMLWSAEVVGIAVASSCISDRSMRRRLMTSIMWISGLLAIKYIFIDTLFWRLHGAAHVAPLLNFEMTAGLVVIASTMVMRWLIVRELRSDGSGAMRLHNLRGQLMTLGMLVIAWMGTMEIDRAVTWYGVAGLNRWHTKSQLLSIWWMICVAGAFSLRRRIDRDTIPTERWLRVLPACATLIALKYIVIDSMAWRLIHRPIASGLLLNVEAAASAMVLGGLVSIAIVNLPEIVGAARRLRLRNSMLSICVIVLLCAVTVEVDRAFWLPAVRAMFAEPWLAEQVAISIVWALFAVASVIFGFVLRAARMRYFGLALLAITLCKVAVIDLRGVETGYRILSFLGLGLLLLGTSVLYGKLSPKLLRSAVETPPTT